MVDSAAVFNYLTLAAEAGGGIKTHKADGQESLQSAGSSRPSRPIPNGAPLINHGRSEQIRVEYACQIAC